MKKILLSGLLCWSLFLALPAQEQECFDIFYHSGTQNLADKNYDQAIIDFLVALNTCDKLDLNQRKEIGARLDTAILLSKRTLQEAVDLATERKAVAEKETQRAKMRYFAYLAQRELELGHRPDALALAFQAQEYSRILGEPDPGIAQLLGKTVWENYRMPVGKRGLFPIFTADQQLAVVEGQSFRSLPVSGEEIQESVLPEDAAVFTGYWLPATSHLLFLTEDGDPILTNQSGKVLTTLKREEKPVTANADAHQTGLLATGYPDGEVVLWAPPSGQPVRVFSGHEGKILALHFSPDGKRLLSRSADLTASLWEVSSGKLIARLDGHQGYLSSVAFLKGGDQLVTADAAATIHLWGRNGNPARTLEPQTGSLLALDIAPDQEHNLTIFSDQTIILWTAEGNQQQLIRLEKPARNAVFMPEGAAILVWSANDIMQFDLRGNPTFQFTTGDQINQVRISPDGSHLLAGSQDGKVWLLDEKGEVLLEAEVQESIKDQTFSPDGKYFLLYTHAGNAWLCPTPSYIYQQLQNEPPAFSPEVRNRYQLDRNEVE